MANSHGRLLTVPQVADRLGCSRTHVYDLDRQLCRHNISATGGTKTRYCETGVDAYIASNAVPSTAA